MLLEFSVESFIQSVEFLYKVNFSLFSLLFVFFFHLHYTGKTERDVFFKHVKFVNTRMNKHKGKMAIVHHTTPHYTTLHYTTLHYTTATF